MRLEPLNRQSDWVAVTAVICGLAPLPLGVFSMVPLAGCLTFPFVLLAPPCAIGFGIAGIVRAKNQPEPNYVIPIAGLVLGLMWLVLMGGGAALAFLPQGKLLHNFRHH